MADKTRVIIVNYNAGDALLECVASVLATHEPLEVIVADNSSSDRSVEELRNRFGSSPLLSIAENPQNLGFGKAVNACAGSADEPYLLILNPDCELFPDTLARLRSTLEQDGQAALAAPLVVNSTGQPMRGNLRYLPNVRRALMTGSGLHYLSGWIPGFAGVEISPRDYPDSPVPAEAVSGACMLVRTGVFREVHGFDEQFTMHFEDLDLMARVRQKGFHCVFVPTATAVHHAGVSSASRPFWVHRQKHLGMQRYFQKHVYGQGRVLTRMTVNAANWLHYLLGLPVVLLRYLRR